MALTPKDKKNGTENAATTEPQSNKAVGKTVDKSLKKAEKQEQKKAATQSAQNDALLREVDEGVRQDQFADFGKRYGRPIIALLVIGLIGFGIYLWWNSSQESKKEVDSERIISAEDSFQAGDNADGQKKLGDLPDEGHSDGARTAAKMLKAGAQLEAGKPKEAAALFEQIANDGDAPQEMRDLANIRVVTIRYDTMKPSDVEAQLKPLATPGNPYFGSAGELVGMAMLEQGKKKEAGTLFGEIAKNEDVPQTIRARARQMAGLLGVDSITDVEKFVKEQMASAPPVSQRAQ